MKIFEICLLSGEVVNVRTAELHYPANTIRRMMFNIRYFGKGSEDGGPGFEEEEHVSLLFAMLLRIYAFCVSDYFPWLRTLDLDGHQKMVCEAMKVVNKYHDPIATPFCLKIRFEHKSWLVIVLDSVFFFNQIKPKCYTICLNL